MLEYIPIAKSVALRVFNQCPYYDLDELEAEAFYGLAKLLPRYNPEKKASIKTFLYGRIYWHLIDYVRKQDFYPVEKRKEIAKGTMERATFEPLDTANEPYADEVATIEYQEEVQALMNRASDSEREVMQGILDGLKGKEIARKIGQHENKVSRTLCNIRKQWRTHSAH